MRRLKTAFFTLFPIIILSIACQSETAQPDPPPQSDSGQISAVTVNLLEEGQLKKFIEQRNNRVLFINVWATWCIPCREEFPDLIRLAENYKSKNIDFISISADYPDEIESKIIPFLDSQQINFPVYVQNFKRQEDFINFLNVDWSGALPASFIYDALGEQKSFLLGKQSYQQFATALENEL